MNLDVFFTIHELSRKLDCPVYHLGKLLKDRRIQADAVQGGRALFAEKSLPLIKHAVELHPNRAAAQNSHLMPALAGLEAAT